MMGRDFKGFLGNLAKIFPSLATRPLYIIGESYAGVYIVGSFLFKCIQPWF
jgi:carboxypeptidase D